MVTASTLAKLAATAMKSSKDAAVLIEAAGVVVSAASTLLKEAKPMLDDINTDAIVEKMRTGARSAADGASKAGSTMKDAAGGAADAIGGAFSKLGDAKDGILSDLAAAKSEKELRRAIKEARQAVLENATTTITITDLLKAAEKLENSAIGPISDMPGCFVIATYKKFDFDNDLTDYTGIYVGKAINASEGVFAAISRDGDPDVYADVKFKQNVHVYVYNCLADSLDERYINLCQTFTDDRLYGPAAQPGVVAKL